MNTPAFGIIPEHPPWLPRFCDARDPSTGTLCDLEPGHDGCHQATITLEWLPEENP